MSSKSKWVNQLSKKKSKLLMEKPSFMVKFPKLSHPDNEKELPKVIGKLEDVSNMDDYDKRHHKLMLDIVGEDIKDWKQFIKDTDIHVIRLKMKYGRPRPYELSDKIDSKTDTDDSPSFPSGHATEAYALEKVLGNKYPDKKKELKEMADKIAMSRVQMGNHFPSDIKAGKKVGYLIADEYLQLSKSWKYVLKAPLYQGEEFEQPEDNEGFEWLNRFNVNDTNVKFISEDGSVRATIKLNPVKYDVHWQLYLFVTKESLRGQGYGEKGLVEMIEELRAREQELLDGILRVYKKYSNNPNRPDMLERSIMDAKPPLDIVLKDVDPDAKIFWQRMVNRYSHLGLKK
jgi:hypothetical protein